MTVGNQATADFSRNFDVLVVGVGGGNAAICAAMTARETGVRVSLLESSPREFRGGNSRHTRNLRCLRSDGDKNGTSRYDKDEFWGDLVRVTEGNTKE